MGKRFFIGSALVIGISATPLTALRANDPNFLFKNLCSPSLRACAGVQIFTTPRADGGTAVVIKMRNLEGVPGVDARPGRIAGLTLHHKTDNAAFGNIAAPAPGEPLLRVSTEGTVLSNPADDPESGWLAIPFGPPIPLNLRLSGVVGGGTFGNLGIAGCTNIPVGYTDIPVPNPTVGTAGDQTCGGGLSWVVFSFDMTGSWLAQDVNLGILFAAGSRQSRVPYLYPDACGSPIPSGLANPQLCEEIDASYTTTPEPITLALLGTGLAGVALARRRRSGRKRTAR